MFTVQGFQRNAHCVTFTSPRRRKKVGMKKAKRREQRQTNDLQKNRLIHPCCHTLQDEKCLQMKPFCLSLLFCLFALIHDDHVVRFGLLYTAAAAGYGLDVCFFARI